MADATHDITFEWRGSFTNDEVNRLHAEAFETRLFDESEWNWRELTAAHSLGWVVARRDGELVGFVNVRLRRAGPRLAAGHHGGGERPWRGHRPAGRRGGR